MTESLEALERDKYERMWAVDSYDKVSPGLQIAPTAFREMGMVAGQHLYDFGCGKGHAVDWFRGVGIAAQGIDHVQLRTDIWKCCLWQLPDRPAADWGFSADVMEHIPPEKVDDVLAGIRRLTCRGAFFQIATRPDRMGRLIGETLHLTVQPREWWVDRLREYWPDVRTGDGAVDWQFWASCTDGS